MVSERCLLAAVVKDGSRASAGSVRAAAGVTTGPWTASASPTTILTSSSSPTPATRASPHSPSHHSPSHQYGQPRSGPPPEGRGGAGRPGSRPMAMTNIRCWARRTPCSAASDPLPGAWRPATDPAGLGDRLRRIQTPGTGARMVCPPAGRGIGLRPPAPALRPGPAGEPPSHLRGTRTIAEA